jgi:hypothetical protein
MPIDQTTVLARSTPEGEAEYQALISELRQVWFDLEPIPKQPWLSGLDTSPDIWVVGHADHHAATATYRTYRVLRWGRIPLVFLGAYRVCEGPVGNKVFIGRHPLPLWALAWNGLGIPAAVALVAFSAYILVSVVIDPFR